MSEDVPVVTSHREVQQALSTGAKWLWWREELTRTVLEPDALEQLRAAASVVRGARHPVLVASLVLDAHDRPVGPVFQPDFGALAELIWGAERRLVPIRAAATTSALVHRDAFERHGVPRAELGRHAGLEWSARVLAEEVGWVAAGSVARASPPEPVMRAALLEEARASARMARTGVWSRGQATRQLVQAASALARAQATRRA